MATFTLQLCENIVKQFKSYSPLLQPAALIGTVNTDSSKLSVHTVIVPKEKITDGFIRSLECSLSSDLKIIGFWAPNDVNTDIDMLISYLVQDDQNYVLRWQCSVDDILKKNIDSSQFSLNRMDGVDEVQCDLNVTWISPEDLVKKTLTIKFIYSAPLELQLTEGYDNNDIEAEVNRAFGTLINRFSGSIDNETEHVNNIGYSFKTKYGNVLLSEYDSILPADLTFQSTCFDLWRYLQQSDDGKVKRKDLQFSQDSIEFKMLRHVTEKCDGKPDYVPVVYYEINNFTVVTIPLRLNVIYVCPQSTTLTNVPLFLKLAVLRQLESAKECFLKFSNFKERKFIVPEPYIFLPSSFTHFITVHYPKGISNSELEPYRKSLCVQWKLPLDRPTIRRENRFSFPDEYGVYLRNVHRYVGSSGMANGTVGLVQGSYQYYHYMQNNFDDKGWGCAYRSFQTVWSWLLLQGYTEKPVPSHREIQQALVDIGDRPANFVGTKQWIGSMELSFCLNHMLDISSKILSVSSGAEMLSKARELIVHFETEGSPVMIGGGVLAHTILGVQFDEDVGEAKFLILDPHYTGDENIKTIVDKGWCGWKPISFWDASAFYNMLLPQRPKTF